MSATSPNVLSVLSLTSLVVLVDCFFNSLVVGVPCSLIFWHFWLFIDFRLVVILLLVVRGSEGFLPIPPSWLEHPHFAVFFSCAEAFYFDEIQSVYSFHYVSCPRGHTGEKIAVWNV